MDFKAKLKQEWPALLIVAVAAVLRLLLLGMKPPHFDEGVNGWFVDQMTRTGYYKYDPTNYHGPFHFYVLFLAQTLLGRHVWALRLPLVLASIGAVWLTTRFERFLGRRAALWAAAAMAVSPGCVFYGRYAIHEYWLVISLMLCAWGVCGLWRYGERKYYWAVWIGITGAVLNKETFIIHFVAAALTVGWLALVAVINPVEGEDGKMAPQKWKVSDVILALVICTGCIVLFYTGGFRYMKGIEALGESFTAWYKTGQSGNGHEKVWYYWIQLFGPYEWPSGIGLLAGLPLLLPRLPRWARIAGTCAVVMVVGFACVYEWTGFLPRVCEGMLNSHFVTGLLGKHYTPADAAAGLAAACKAVPTWPWLLVFGGTIVALWCAAPGLPLFARALAVYGIGTLTAYSIVHYKTPWCIISLTWPFLLLFGFAVDHAARRTAGAARIYAGAVFGAFGVTYAFANFSGRVRVLAGSMIAGTALSLALGECLEPVAALAGATLAGNLYYTCYLNYFHYTDEKEPYVYVQTYNDVNRLMRPLEKLVALDPVYHDLHGLIIMDSYHPLPWLLGDYPNVAYYGDNMTPPSMDADFLLVENSRIDDVEAALHGEYFTFPLHLRDAMDTGKLYLSARVFQPVFPGKKPDFLPPGPGTLPAKGAKPGAPPPGTSP